MRELLAAERSVDSAREDDYREGNDVRQVVKRFEAAQDRSPAQRMENLSCVKSRP